VVCKIGGTFGPRRAEGHHCCRPTTSKPSALGTISVVKREFERRGSDPTRSAVWLFGSIVIVCAPAFVGTFSTIVNLSGDSSRTIVSMPALLAANAKCKSGSKAMSPTHAAIGNRAMIFLESGSLTTMAPLLHPENSRRELTSIANPRGSIQGANGTRAVSASLPMSMTAISAGSSRLSTAGVSRRKRQTGDHRLTRHSRQPCRRWRGSQLGATAAVHRKDHLTAALVHNVIGFFPGNLHGSDRLQRFQIEDRDRICATVAGKPAPELGSKGDAVGVLRLGYAADSDPGIGIEHGDARIPRDIDPACVSIAKVELVESRSTCSFIPSLGETPHCQSEISSTVFLVLRKTFYLSRRGPIFWTSLGFVWTQLEASRLQVFVPR